MQCLSLLHQKTAPATIRMGSVSPQQNQFPVSKTTRRRLIPNLEHVTCRERTVTPISSAISSRRFPRSTRFLICGILSGVNFIPLPRAGSCVENSVCVIFLFLQTLLPSSYSAGGRLPFVC